MCVQVHTYGQVKLKYIQQGAEALNEDPENIGYEDAQDNDNE